MAFCPNKNLRAWIDLEIAQPERSYQLWDEYKGNVPSKYYNVKPLLDKVKKELKFRSPLFTSELILLKSRLKDYNTKNGTSHKLNITKIGESDRHKVDLYLDYTPVNEEMRREREAIRSEEGKSFYNIEETNREDIVNPLIEEARRIQLEDAKRAGIDYDDRYLFNQTIGIKPGVAELFESDPKLANAVYEAAGLIDEAGFKETSKYEMSLGEAKFTGVEPFTEKEQSEIDRLNDQQKQQAQQLYSQYLDTIFPDSKVKDIVYHTNTRGYIDFNERLSKGLFVTPTWELAKTYKPYGSGKRFQLLIDSKNIKDVEENIIMEGKQLADEDTLRYIDNYGEYTELVVFEPEQIHILGSKQDIDNFANFVSYENSSYSKIGSIQQFRDYIMSKNFAAVEEFLVVNNKIDRKC